jgi:hypothetical protein
VIEWWFNEIDFGFKWDSMSKVGEQNSNFTRGYGRHIYSTLKGRYKPTNTSGGGHHPAIVFFFNKVVE